MTTTTGRRLTYLEAINTAMHEEMERDPAVFLMGEDVAWNAMGSSGGLVERFGSERVRNTPISEAGFVGAAAGAAMVGMRPIVDMLMAPFMYPAMDQLVSIIAKSTFTYGGQASLPLVIRAPMMYGASNAAQHSDRPYSTMMTIPGLKILVPSTPTDMLGMLKTAIRDDDPVICFEDAQLWGQAETVPDGDVLVPIGSAAVRRPGSDVTLVSLAASMITTLRAADRLAADGISAEVIDLRSIVPLDRETILESVERTGRLVVVDPAHEMGSVASEVTAIVAQEGFWSLSGPIQRVTTPHTHIPYAASMERPLWPSIDRIVAAVRRTLD